MEAGALICWLVVGFRSARRTKVGRGVRTATRTATDRAGIARGAFPCGGPSPCAACCHSRPAPRRRNRHRARAATAADARRTPSRRCWCPRKSWPQIEVLKHLQRPCRGIQVCAAQPVDVAHGEPCIVDRDPGRPRKDFHFAVAMRLAASRRSDADDGDLAAKIPRAHSVSPMPSTSHSLLP